MVQGARREAVAQSWGRETLTQQIRSQLHLRHGAPVTNFAQRLPAEHAGMAAQILKDPCHFDFLGLGDEAHERDIELALTRHIIDERRQLRRFQVGHLALRYTDDRHGLGIVSHEAFVSAPGLLRGRGYAWNWNGVQSLFIDFLGTRSFAGARIATLSPTYWTNASDVTVFGYDALGNVVATSSRLSLTNDFESLNANFAAVAAVEFRANADGQWFSVDDIAVGPSQDVVPEPGSWVPMVSGLVALAGLACRRHRRA